MQCREFREIADSFLGGEVAAETDHDIIEHLEACVVCRRELSARQNLRERLRAACTNAPESQARAEFVGRLRIKLRASASQNLFFNRRALWSAVVACVIFAGAFGWLAIRQWRQRVDAKSNQRSVVFT